MKKVFTFGNGGVVVGRCWLNRYVEFTQIKPPMGYVGRIKSGDLDNKEELYSIKIKGDELKSVKNQISSLTEPTILEFEDFILDFSDFNEKSVKVVLEAVNEALRGCPQIALAC